MPNRVHPAPAPPDPIPALPRLYTGADVWDVDPRAHYRRHPGVVYHPVFAASELIGG